MAITYSISGGADAAKFNIDASTGKLTFKTAPDFEAKADANRDNIYEVQVKATDAGGAASTQDMRVTVTDVSENAPPQITSAAAVSVKENQTTVMTVTATDPDEGGGSSGSLPWTAPNPNITNFTGADGQRWTGVGGMEVANHNGSKAWSLTKPDSQTLRFEVRNRDQWPWDADHNDNERSELQWVYEHPVNKDLIVQYEFMMEAGQPATSWFFVLEQIQTPPGGTPPFYIGIENNQHVVRLATDASQQNYVYPFRGELLRGHWYQMQVKNNFSAGRCEIIRDGVKIVDYSGPYGNNQGGTQCWQIGIYRNGAAETCAVNYRNLLITKG